VDRRCFSTCWRSVRPSFELTGSLLSSGLRCRQFLEGISSAEKLMELRPALIGDCHAAAVPSLSQEQSGTHFSSPSKFMPVGATKTREGDQCFAALRHVADVSWLKSGPARGAKTGPLAETGRTPTASHPLFLRPRGRHPPDPHGRADSTA
jgi:hypothetical protein